MKHYFIIILILILNGSSGYAQVNIEKYQKNRKNKNMSHEIYGDISYNNGNSNAMRLGLDIRSRYQLNRWKWLFIMSADKEESNRVDYINKQLYHLRLGTSIQKKLDLETFFQVEKDEFLRINQRTLIGAGARKEYELSSKAIHINGGIGMMNERIQYLLASDINTNQIRINTYLSSTYTMNNMALDWIVYYQPNIKAFSDYQVLSSMTWKINITQHIKSTTNLHYRHDSTPLSGLKSEDLKLTNGIGLQF